MKRYLLIFSFIFAYLFGGAMEAQADVWWFKTTKFSYKERKLNYEGNYYWTSWANWQRSSLSMKIDFDEEIVTIYSEKIQMYKLLYEMEPPYDSSGTQVKYKVIDQDGDYGDIRFRVENDGSSQVYIDFADISWVYCVIRTS